VAVKRLYAEHSGLSGVGVLLLIVLLMIVAVVGGGVAQPMVVQQDLKAGDQVTYRVVGDLAGIDEGERVYTFTATTVDDAVVNFSDGNVSMDFAVSLDRDGVKLIIDDAPFLSLFWFMSLVRDNVTDFEKTMEFDLVGLTPMALDVYTGEVEFSGETTEMVVKTKMNTDIPLFVELSRGDDRIRMEIVDTSINWISYHWGLF